MAKGSSSKKTAWKVIQKRETETNSKASSIKSQDSRKITEDKSSAQETVSRSRSSTITSDKFEDALSDDMEEDEEDEDDDYFQDEDPEEEKQKKEMEKLKELAIIQDKERNKKPLAATTAVVKEPEQRSIEEHLEENETPVKKPTRMSFILPALQSHGYSSDEDDDNESLKDPNEKYMQAEKEEVERQQSSSDLVAEIEALEIASVPVTMPKSPSNEKPATYEPIPVERPYVPPKPIQSEPDVGPATADTVKKEPIANKQDQADEIHTVHGQVTQKEYKDETKATPAVIGVVASTDDNAEFKAMAESATDLNAIATNKQSTEIENQDHLDSGISVSIDTARSSTSTTADEPSKGESKTVEEDNTIANHLATILPAVEESVRAVQTEKAKEKLPPPPVRNNDDHLLPEDRERANRSREFEYSIEDPVDLDMFRDNVIAIQAIDPKDIPINNMKPHEQEKADEPVREGMKYLFDNKFMKAKSVFQTKASIDPLYALGLGSMAFIKAIMTYHESDIEVAMNALATAYTIAKTQIDNTSFKKPFKDTVSQYFTTLLSSNSTGLPVNPPLTTMPNSSGGIASPNAFIPNGVLRAHVVKAECCLLMGILQMTQESVVGYLKCGLNLRRAYNSYSVVWQEYKRMGQEYKKYMDRDTVSAIQFGIGSVHLILSSMPPKILKIFSILGWKSDQQLGFALLKLCLEGRGIRAPLASLTLLAYYSVLTSFAPQLYSKDMMGPAIECLLDAQSIHPNSCFFLFFAARIARVARNLPLSTQSFTFAAESSRGEWAEVAMKQMSDYEIGFNLALELEWEAAANYFEQLSREKYWSPAFSKYFVGACCEMMGQRTEAILAFAEVPVLAKDQQQTKTTYIDAYVVKKVEFFQKSGYQDMDFSLPGLEIMLVMNAFEYMEKEALEQCLDRVQRTLELVYEREKMEYNIRLRELVPVTNPPDYYDQRSVLLLTKASILNSLGRYDETIPHLNWILDHKDCIKEESWVIPFTYWESGVTSWGLGNLKKSRKLWQLAMTCTKYDFEYRMAVRLSLALSKCDEVGIPDIDDKDAKGSTTNGRKRMPILNTW